MKAYAFRRLILSISAIAGIAFLTSCTVDEEAALFSNGGAASGDKKKERTATVKTDGESWAEKMKAAREEREKKKAEEAKAKAKELAAKKKEEEAAARKAAYEKRKEEAAKKALAEKEAREKAKAEAEKKALAKKEAEEKAKAEAEKKALAEKKAKEKAARKAAEEKRLAEEKKEREEKFAAERKEREERKKARIAARERAEENAERERRSQEIPAVADRRSRGGFFSSLAVSTPNQYKSKGHHIHVNNRLLGSLNASNSKIEISLSQQRARIYKTGGGTKQLVIETQISSGKPGHATPTGTFRIKEKLVAKRSTLYGRWLNSSGGVVQSSGDSRKRPSGGSSFVGAEMPYWMRINGGIGMHIGYVPNGPASHGCIRVPPTIQPLIYSKVGVGTPVTISY